MIRTGGCQCGAVRYRVEGELGRASICHCRMCQKAFGGFYGPYVSARAEQITWTRGRPTYFASSNVVKRGFCETCGTQLTFEGGPKWSDLTIGSFDDPTDIRPVVAIGLEAKLPYADEMCSLPGRSPEEEAKLADYYAGVVSNQHPDHDT